MTKRDMVVISSLLTTFDRSVGLYYTEIDHVVRIESR